VPQGPEFRANTYTTSNQLFSAVQLDADGDFIIAWASGDQDGSGYGIYGQCYNAAGVPQGPEFRANSFTLNWQIQPAVGMDADGDFVLAWESREQDGSGSGIYAQRYAVALNQPPVLAPIADRTVPSSQQVLTVPLSATDPDGDALMFSATAQSLAYVLDQQYDFFTDGNFYENAFGASEKWVQSAAIASGWALILPNGELRAWDGVSGSTGGTVLGNVGSSYHVDPNRLINVPVNEPRATLMVMGSTLTITRDLAWISALVVTVTVSDGFGGTDSETFTVTVV
jgi:hypothetical protein